MYVLKAVAVVLVAFAAKVDGYHDGAGDGACTGASMMPVHGPPAQDGDSPFTVVPAAEMYRPGGTLNVTLSGSKVFKGFLLLALPTSGASSTPIGSFEVVSNAGGMSLTQDRCSGGATHTSTFHGAALESIQLIWNAPADSSADVTFYATFVEVKATFWVKVSAARPVRAMAAATTASTAKSTTASTAKSTTAAPAGSSTEVSGAVEMQAAVSAFLMAAAMWWIL